MCPFAAGQSGAGMGGIEQVARGFDEEPRRRLPGQRRTRREGLALLAATMLDVRSAKLMELAAALPRAAGRIDMRCQRHKPACAGVGRARAGQPAR